MRVLCVTELIKNPEQPLNNLQPVVGVEKFIIVFILVINILCKNKAIDKEYLVAKLGLSESSYIKLLSL